MSGHFAHDFFGEGTGLSRGSDENVGFDLFHDRKQIIMVGVLPVGVFAGVRNLSGGQGAFLGFEKEAGFVDTPVDGISDESRMLVEGGTVPDLPSSFFG